MKKLDFLTIIVFLLICSCVRNTKTEIRDEQKNLANNVLTDPFPVRESVISRLDDKYIIVLDIQEFPITKDFPNPPAQSQIGSINYLIENCNPDQVIYVVSASLALSVSHKGITIDTVSIPAFDQRLKVVNNNVFVKSKGNAFTSKDLIDFLKKHDVRKIVVIGLMAERCVRKSLLGGKKLGYEMFTIPEAVIGKTPDSKQEIMKELAKKEIHLL